MRFMRCFFRSLSPTSAPLAALSLLLGLIPAASASDKPPYPPIGDLDHITSPLAPEYQLDTDGSVTLRVCYNWACSTRPFVTFTRDDLAEVAAQMAKCREETLYGRLQRIRIGIWQMEVMAQKYLPDLANDRAVNDQDKDEEGAMDCVDNASNTTTYLRILHDLGKTPGWTILAPEVRERFSLEAVHWTAAIADQATGAHWTVDSWFRPNGHLPFVEPLAAWLEAKKAWDPPYEALNPSPPHVEELCRSGAPAQVSALR